MRLNDKQRVVEELNTALKASSSAIVAHYRGLTVSQMGELRNDLHKAGQSLQVVKNSLAKRASQDTEFAVAEPLFKGPTVLAYGSDPVALAKALSDFAKKHDAMQVLGGVLDGKLIDSNNINALASLPSREVLLAKMLGSMQSPITGFVRTLSEVPASFVRTLAAIRDQKETA